MLFSRHVKMIKILRTIFTVLITCIAIVTSVYIASMLGFVYPRTIHRVSVYMPLNPPEATPTTVFILSLISLPISCFLFKNNSHHHVLFYLTIILALISLLNVFFEYFAPSILLLTILILFISYIRYKNIGEILISFAILSISTLASCILSITTPLHDVNILATLSELDISFWSLISSTTPIIYLLILLSPFWRKLLLSFLLKRQQRKQIVEQMRIDNKIEFIVIAIGVFMSIVFYVLPYTSLLNPRRTIVTTDIVIYIARLNEMESQKPVDVALRYPDRSLYLLILYGLKKLFNCDNVTIATVSGWMWSALLVVSVWFLTRELFGREAALFAVLLTPLSHQMLSFIYGGFHANQFTIPLLYIAMALISRISLKRFILSILILSISSLCHTWSYVHITSSIILYALMRTIGDKEDKRLRKYYVLLVIILLTMVAIGEITLHNISYTSQLLFISFKDIRFIIRSLLANLSNNKLFDAFAYYLWGSLNIPFLYILAIIAILKREKSTILDYVYVSTLGYSTMFLNSIDIVSRLCINVPMQIEIANMGISKNYAILIMTILLGNAIYLIFNAVPA